MTPQMGFELPEFLPVGDHAMTVQFGETVDPIINQRVVALACNLEDRPIAGICETVPTYRSLLLSYDPAIIRGAALQAELTERIAALSVPKHTGRLWHVPVAYGGSVGQDLDELAAGKGMTTQALIDLHSSVEYRVYMIGFAPGFVYLGGLPDVLHTPRLPAPRMSIPAGAIGIGGQQGSINSVTGPSGWRFIGWTPWSAFDVARTNPFLFAAGDRIRFAAVDAEAARSISEAVKNGTFEPKPEASS